MYRQEIAVSDDGGESWEFLPEDADRYYGTAVVRFLGNTVYSEGRGGLHRSTDDGRTWETLQTEPPTQRCLLDYHLEAHFRYADVRDVPSRTLSQYRRGTGLAGGTAFACATF